MATITPAKAVINLFMKWLIADSPSYFVSVIRLVAGQPEGPD